VRRRDLFNGIVGTAVFARVAAAQQSKVPIIGVLVVGSPGSEQFWKLFRTSLRELGYIEGQNIGFEFRSDQGQSGRLPALAEELVRLSVDVIVTWFTPAALAAKNATREIPIIMAVAGNPVETGLVETLGRPGGNVTGLAGVGAELAEKSLDLIVEMIPAAHRVAALANAPDPFSKPFIERIQLGGKAAGIIIDPIMIHSIDELEPTFAAFEKGRPDAMIVQGSLPTKLVAELALRHRVPTTSIVRGFVEDGGLMTYVSSEVELYRRAAVFVEKMLKGAKPANLPVEQPTKFELVINMKTAKALGLTVPQSLLQRADEVLE
jgi:putative tryptophan/tyrosine transport system substrate-binding protein